MKKTIAMLLAVVMIAGMFAACSGSASSAAASAGSAASSAPAKVEKVTINFPCIWVGTDSKAEYFGKMVSDFNKENEGAIEVVIEEQTDYQAYRDKIRTSITAGQAPDVFSFDNLSDVATYSSSGKLMDLSQYLGEGWGDNFSDGSLAAAQYNGANFCVPYEKATFGVYYNAKMLEEVGYTEFPQTYDDLFALCDKLKAAGYIPMCQMSGENAWTSMLWYSQILVSIGGPDIYSKGLDDPAYAQAATILKKMYDYTSSDAVGAGAAVVNGHFLNAQAAIYMNGPWFIPRFAKEGVEGLADNVKVAYAPMAAGGKGTYGGMIGVAQAYLAAAKQDDPNKEAAVVKFLQYITDPQRTTEFAAAAGTMFFVKSQATTEANPIRASLLDLSEKAAYTVPHFQGAMPTAVANEFPQALSGLVLGEIDEQGFVDMLKAAQEKAG